METPLYEKAFKPTFDTDDMVKFLQYILNNPQTNTQHAFNAFIDRDLDMSEPVEPEDDGTPDIREMEIPVIEAKDPRIYDDEEDYQSKGFDDYNIDVTDDMKNVLYGTSFREDEPITTSPTAAPTIEKTTPQTTTTTQGKIATPNVVLSTLESEYFSLSWDRVPEADSYELMLFDTASNAVQEVFTTEEQFYVFTEMAPETKYKVMVHAVDKDGERSLASGMGASILTISSSNLVMATSAS